MNIQVSGQVGYLGYTCTCGMFYTRLDKFINCCESQGYFDTIPVQQSEFLTESQNKFICNLCGKKFKSKFTA